MAKYFFNVQHLNQSTKIISFSIIHYFATSLLFNQVKQWFNQHKEDNFSDSDIEISYHQQTQKAHHRIETRKVWAIPVTAFGGLYQQEEWIGLTTIVIVERTRRLWNKNTHQVQFYLSSLPADAQKNGSAIRKHWAIENQMHWTLDVTFSEDKCIWFSIPQCLRIAEPFF